MNHKILCDNLSVVVLLHEGKLSVKYYVHDEDPALVALGLRGIYMSVVCKMQLGHGFGFC